MLKTVLKILCLGITCFIIYAYYDYRRAGFHTIPEDIPEGAYPISFKTGLRAIMIDVPDVAPKRVFRGYALEVDSYLEDVWSYCTPFSGEAAEAFLAKNANWLGVGEKPEATCLIQVDDEEVMRGFITSRPNFK